MANKVITFIVNTVEPDIDAILAAAINEITKAGHTLTEVRVADDSGEVKVAPNTVAGVTPPPEETPEETPTEPTEPATEPAPVEGAPVEGAPVEGAPVDAPVEPTPVVEDTPTA